MIPLSVDAMYTDEDIAQFSSQLQFIPEAYIELIRKKLGGAQSPEFYLGLLTGYANSLVAIRDLSQENALELTTVLVAYVSNHIHNSP